MELSQSSVATTLSDSATSDGGTAAVVDEALRRLSEHFATLLLSPDHTDAFLIIIKGDSELEIPIHRCLSEHFVTLLLSPDHTDAFLIIIKCDSELEIAVQRCVLAARSPFFKRHFSTIPKEPMIKMKDLVSEFDVWFDSLSAVLGYLYTGRVGPRADGGMCVRRRGLLAPMVQAHGGFRARGALYVVVV